MNLESNDHAGGAVGVEPYVRALPQESRREALRDWQGKLLAPGTPVLCHPSAPWEFLEDNPANRARFLGLGCAWSEKVRQRIWFPPAAALPSQLRAQLEQAASARRQFLARVSENLRASVGAPFPRRRLPAKSGLLPWKWAPQIRRVQHRADLTQVFLGFIAGRSGAPPGLGWPESWREWLAQLNAVQVYSVRGWFHRAHVVVAFVCPLRFHQEAAPELAPLDPWVIEGVDRAYRDWASARAGKWPHRARQHYRFAALGCAGELPPGQGHILGGDHCMVVCSVRGDGQWTAPPLEPWNEPTPWRDFLDRLLPETDGERLHCRKRLIWAPG